jgi:hypothetical protein
MTKGDHIYTLNYNIKSLEQQQNEEDKNQYIVKASSDYKVSKDDEETNYYRMVNTVDDIFRIIKEIQTDEKQLLYLVHQSDNLINLYFQLVKAGYESKPIFESGRVVRLIAAFNNISIIIKTQQLITSSTDGFIAVDSEEVYNKMNQAMTKYNKQLFKKEHKSYYTEQDIDILDEYRTVVNVGKILPIDEDEDMVEIDVTKAFTKAFTNINKIPIFNEFDNFIPYDNSKIQDYNLYIIEVDDLTLLFNKKFNLCYGYFLNKLKSKNIKIIAYKQPSFIKDVNYKSIIDDLYKTEISQNQEEDKYIKKLISNVNSGLLEKSYNKKQNCFIYDTIEEARSYQIQYGGHLNIIKEIEHIEEIVYDEDGDSLPSEETNETGNKHYILSISDRVKLRNGFRYIKELLLQYHNYFIYKSYKKLSKNNIPVYSVKNDAFTIKEDDLQQCKELLNFDEGIGNWRLSKDKNIIYPTDDLTFKINNEIKVEPLKINKFRCT